MLHQQSNQRKSKIKHLFINKEIPQILKFSSPRLKGPHYLKHSSLNWEITSMAVQ